MDYRVKSLKVNMILNLFKTLFTTFFPLLSFKYVSSVLGKNGIGTYNFCNSFVQYFSILAALGISTYAVRECAKIRDEKQKINELGCELFSINIISSIIAYIILLIFVFSVSKIYFYRNMILILSLSIMCTTFNVEWVNIVYEDFLYITIRTIFFQILSFVIIVVLVKNENDYIRYAIITIFTSACISMCNWIYVKKYVTLKFVLNKRLLEHLKSIFTIFFMNIAITIYVTSDITILGLIKGNSEVGLYTVSTKIYSSLKTILASVISATIPRLSYTIEKNINEYIRRLKDVVSVLLLLCIPIIVGVCLLPEFLIKTIASEEYYECKYALKLLSIAIFPTLLSTVVNSNVLLAQRKERLILLSTCIGGIVNCILNIILIPMLGINAAALTTLISEVLVCVIAIYQGHKTLMQLELKLICIDFFKVIIGIMGIVITYYIFFWLIKRTYATSICFIVISMVVYFMIELFFRHSGISFLISRKER